MKQRPEHKMRLAFAIAVAAGVTACSQGDSGNVMAPDANALTPAEVNLALGNDPAAAPDANSADTNQAEVSVNETGASPATEPANAATPDE